LEALREQSWRAFFVQRREIFNSKFKIRLRPKIFNIEKHGKHECLRQYIFCHTEITENTEKRFHE